MLTNSIAQLAPGEGCYNFALNAQGHIQADLTAFLLEDSILLETSRDQIEKLLDHLNRFIIMDDVELADISVQRRGLLIAGPDASSLLAAIGLSSEPTAPHQLTHLTWRAVAVDLIHAHSPLVPKFEIWTDSSTFDLIAHELRNAGAFEVDSAALEHLRILEGTPRFGTDIRDKDLPQETAPIGGQSRALHFTKGCYLGQEIVERIHSRGGVHRAFSGFALTGALPAPGAISKLKAGPSPSSPASPPSISPANPRPFSLPSASSAAKLSKTLRPATSPSPTPEAPQPPSPCPMQSPSEFFAVILTLTLSAVEGEGEGSPFVFRFNVVSPPNPNHPKEC